MYSVVLMMAMTASPDAAAFGNGCLGGEGCSGSSCHGGSGIFGGKMFGGHKGGCGGCGGGGMFGLMSGGSCHGSSCSGSSCHGGNGLLGGMLGGHKGNSCSGSSCLGSSCHGSSMGLFGGHNSGCNGSSCMGSTGLFGGHKGGCCGGGGLFGGMFGHKGSSCHGSSCMGSSTGCFGSATPVVETAPIHEMTPTYTTPVTPIVAPKTMPKEMPKIITPEIKKTSLEIAPATIVLNVPTDAKVTFDGNATTQTSATRSFVTPALNGDEVYYYTVTASVVRDGNTLTSSERIAVRAGQTTSIDLSPVAAVVSR